MHSGYQVRKVILERSPVTFPETFKKSVLMRYASDGSYMTKSPWRSWGHQQFSSNEVLILNNYKYG